MIKKLFINFFKLLYDLIISILTGKPLKAKRKGFLVIFFVICLIVTGIIYSQANNNIEDALKESTKSSQTLKTEDLQSSSSGQGNEYSNKYLVTRVVDGDTFVIASGQKVRLIGIDAPESITSVQAAECYGQEASDFLKTLLTDKEVELVKDVSETDPYDRLLRYVYLDGLFINEYLVEKGYARASDYPPDSKYKSLLATAEETAAENYAGLWGDTCQTTKPTSNCNIKGNISWSGQKIYHRPDCPSYDEVDINTTGGEKYFCTESEAIAAGWQKASNCP